jgi:hypothetical protein
MLAIRFMVAVMSRSCLMRAACQARRRHWANDRPCPTRCPSR